MPGSGGELTASPVNPGAAASSRPQMGRALCAGLFWQSESPANPHRWDPTHLSGRLSRSQPHSQTLIQGSWELLSKTWDMAACESLCRMMAVPRMPTTQLPALPRVPLTNKAGRGLCDSTAPCPRGCWVTLSSATALLSPCTGTACRDPAALRSHLLL